MQSFADCRVNGGYISRYGTIRLVYADVQEMNDPEVGSCHYSEQLLIYQNGNFRAKISGESVVVTDADGYVVGIISAENFHLVSSSGEQECVVIDCGYVMPLSMLDKRIMIKALLMAEAGKRPPFGDNSLFVKVSSERKGDHVILLWLDECGRNESAAVFTLSGELIPSEVCHPLAFEKWKIPLPAHDFFDDILGDSDTQHDERLGEY